MAIINVNVQKDVPLAGQMTYEYGTDTPYTFLWMAEVHYGSTTAYGEIASASPISPDVIQGVSANYYEPITYYKLRVGLYNGSELPIEEYEGSITTVEDPNTLLSGLINDQESQYIPSGIYASSGPNETEMTIGWNTSSQVISGYRVYRAESAFNSPFLPIGYTTGVSYIDSGLDSKNTYYYRVTSVY